MEEAGGRGNREEVGGRERGAYRLSIIEDT
jgi:hypothetical protein